MVYADAELPVIMSYEGSYNGDGVEGHVRQSGCSPVRGQSY